MVDVSEEMQAYGLPKGAALQSVTQGSPADKAGLRRNDIVIKIDDTEITSSTELVKYVKNAAVGQELTLTVYRQGDILKITVTVGEQTQAQIQSSQSSSQQIYPSFP